MHLYSLSQSVGLMDNIIWQSIQAHLIQNYDLILASKFTSTHKYYMNYHTTSDSY